MAKSFSHSQVYRLMKEFLRPFDASALVTEDGDVLLIKYENLADIGTLGVTANTVIKYFPLNEGDVVLLNDPYAGGTLLSSLSLITPLHSAGTTIYWVVRTQFRPNLVISTKLEEEGLRIPPTPLVQNREFNQPILDAIVSHPQCPEGLEARLKTVVPEIFRRVDHFRLLMKKHGDLFSKANLKGFLKSSNEIIHDIASEHSTGEVKIETALDSGEMIRLKAEMTHQNLNLDFSGTSASKRVCLTDAATMGACMGALTAFFKSNIPLNEGTFSFLNVVTPLGSMLNSRYPSPTFKGMTEGTSMVAATVLRALSEISTAHKASWSASSPSLVSLDFGKGLKFFDSLPGGVGATADGDGADALHYWSRNRLRNSVEEIESRFPMMIRQISIRTGSGGKGQFRGGHGMVKEFEMLAACDLSWMVEQRKSAPQGMKGAQSGQLAEVHILRGDKKIPLDLAEGTFSLIKGDRVIIATAGGGGFGKSSKD
jgi:N-methylhydantoinase B